jgi:hypothetical protein
MFLGVERGRCIRLTTLLQSMSWLSRQCGIFNISQPYSPPRPVTGITIITITPWPESASELYRSSDRRMSAKLVPTFADRSCYGYSVTFSLLATASIQGLGPIEVICPRFKRPCCKADTLHLMQWLSVLGTLSSLPHTLLNKAPLPKGPGSISGTTRKKNVVGLERGALSLVSTNWEATS